MPQLTFSRRILAYPRRLGFVGAMCLVAWSMAGTAQAQESFVITSADGETAQAELSADGTRLVFRTDEGTFVFVRQQVWDTGVSTFSCEAPPRTISWPEGGNGTLHLLNPESEQWEEIGVVRPDAPAEEPRGEAPEGLPAPTPGPAGGDGYTANAKVLSGHRAAVVCIAFSGNGKILASSDAGGTLKIWDMQNGTEARSSQVAGITSLAFLDDALAVGLNGRHPDADRLQGMVAVVEDGRGGVNLESVQTRVESVAFMDGSLAAGGANMDFEAGREYGLVRLWGGGEQELQPVRDLQGRHGETFHSVAFSPDRRWLAAGGGGEDDAPLGRVTLWNLATYETQAVADLRGVVYSVAFRPGSSELAFGGVQIAGGRKLGFITVKDIPSGREDTRWLDDPVRSIAVSPDGEWMAAGSGAAVLVWKHGEANPIRLDVSGGAQSVAFSPDGNLLAAGGADGKITVWAPGAPEQEETAPRRLPLLMAVIDADGAPIRDVKVYGAGLVLDGLEQDGTYRFLVPGPGNYELTFKKEGYESQTVTVRVQGERSRHTVRLQGTVATPEPPTLTLSVVDAADGKPIPEPTITLSGGATRNGSDPDGTHTFTVPKPGSYDVSVKKAGYEPVTLRVRMEGRDVQQAIRLKRSAPTPKPLTLILTVVEDSDEKVTVEAPTVRVKGGTMSEKRGPGGNHICSVPKAGDYEVSVAKKGYAQKTQSVRVAAEQERLTVRLERKLALTVVDADTSEPVPDCAVSIRGVKAEPLRAANAHRYALEPGTYDVSVSRDGYITGTAPISVGSGITSHEVRLRRAAFTLIVRVRAAGDRPVKGLQVVVPGGQATEPEAGSYAVRLRPGVYDVEVTGGKDVIPPQRVAIVAEDVTVELAPGHGDSRETAARLHRRLDSDGNLRVDAEDVTPAAWQDLAKHDANGNGQIEQEELVPLVEASATDGSLGPRALLDRGAPGRDALDLLVKTLDADGDGRVGPDDVDPPAWKDLLPYDSNRDGVLESAECAALLKPPEAAPGLDRLVPPRQPEGDASLDELEECFDDDGNAKVEKADFDEGVWAKLKPFDLDRNGVLSRDELRAMLVPPPEGPKESTEPARGVLSIREVGKG